MLNAAQEQFGGANPYQSAGSGTGGNSGQGGQQSNASGETAAPVPNPWGGGGGGSGSGGEISSYTQDLHTGSGVQVGSPVPCKF